MKKLTGWILIAFCSFLLLAFAIVLSLTIHGILVKGSDAIQMSIKEILSSSIGFLIVTFLLLIGLKNGIRKVKSDKLIDIIDYNKNLNINLNGIIEYLPYRNLVMGLSFKKPGFIVALGLILMFSLSLMVNREYMTIPSESDYLMFVLIGIFILSPVLTLIQTKRLYNKNIIFQERLNYSLTNDSIRIKGETVDSVQKWAHFQRIRETKRFFMLYRGKMDATLLDKKMFSVNDLYEFQTFTKSLKLKRL
jgi:hypothetical protein